MQILGKYGRNILPQFNLLHMCKTIRGRAAVDTLPHHIDRTSLFGIVINIPENREIIQHLGEIVTNRQGIDDPSLSLKQVFNLVQLSFNNLDVLISSPTKASDLENIEAIDPNDMTRIAIQIL